MRSPHAIPPARLVEQEAVSEWFELVRPALCAPWIDLRFVYNTDETVITLTEGKPLRIAMDIDERARPIVEGGQPYTQHVTFLPLVCADGEAFGNIVLLSSVATFLPPAFQANLPHVLNFRSPNGWITNDLFLHIVINIFVPAIEAKRRRLCCQDTPALLIADGHISRYHPPLLHALSAHNILLIILPPHTTHLLQPLDVGMFGLFKSALRHMVRLIRKKEDFQSRCSELPRAARDRVLLASSLDEAYRQKFTPFYIRDAFAAAGLMPFAPDRVLQRVQFRTDVSSPHPRPAHMVRPIGIIRPPDGA